MPDRASHAAMGIRAPALLACCLAALAWWGLAGAEIYRWVDEDGKVHYTDRPQHSDQTPLNVKPLRPAADPDLELRRERRDRLLHILSEDRERERAAQARQDRERTARAHDCRLARNELSDLERGGVFYELGDQGERRYLSQDQVKQRKDRWRSEVQRLCEAP